MNYYLCTMPFGSVIITSEHKARTAAAARYAFYKQHFSEEKYSDVFKFIKSKRINYLTPEDTTQQDLVDELNSIFCIGDKMKVRQDGGDVELWTVRAKASIVSKQAVIWAHEHRSCYLATRVIF